MKYYTRIPPVVSGLLLLLLLSGCLGYRLGSLGNPDLKSIAVVKVRNDTDEPRLGIYAASKLRSRFVSDGTLALAGRDLADCILEARVKSYALRIAGKRRLESLDESQQIYSAAIWRIEVRVEYTLRAPGKEKPLIAPRTVTGSAEYGELIDLDVVRQAGFRQALRHAADQIVTEVTEAW